MLNVKRRKENSRCDSFRIVEPSGDEELRHVSYDELQANEKNRLHFQGLAFFFRHEGRVRKELTLHLAVSGTNGFLERN